MRKGQKLHKASTLSQQLQVRKNNKEYYKRQRQQARRTSNQPTRSYRTRRPSGTTNKYMYETGSIEKYVDQILDYVFAIIKKFFQKIFS